MARPKRNETTPSATEKIENAYWEMLAEDDYAHITIRSLTRKANVNHNLIYYYYDNIDDLAVKAFENTLSEKAFAKILSIFTSQTSAWSILVEDPSLIENFFKVKLYIRGDSAFLTSIFRTGIKSVWLKQLCLTEQELDTSDQTDLDFIIAGLISVMSGISTPSDVRGAVTILNREIGKAILSTLHSLQLKYRY